MTAVWGPMSLLWLFTQPILHREALRTLHQVNGIVQPGINDTYQVTDVLWRTGSLCHLRRCGLGLCLGGLRHGERRVVSGW
jgi:hypothetical protein